jgi:hypothetical protein
MQANEDIEAICAEVDELTRQIRILAETHGGSWVVTTVVMSGLAGKTLDLKQRVARLADGGLGTAIATAVNWEQIERTVDKLAAILQGNKEGTTIGEIAGAANVEYKEPQKTEVTVRRSNRIDRRRCCRGQD